MKKQLLKRLQNVTTPKKKQGATPSRKRPRSLSFQSNRETSTDETDESTSSTLIIERSPHSTCSTSEVEELDGKYRNSHSIQCLCINVASVSYKTAGCYGGMMYISVSLIRSTISSCYFIYL